RLVLFGFPFASCVIEPQPPEVILTGIIEVLEPRTYVIPSALSHEHFPPVH
ncbi:hypothetical protein E4T56_gene13942, partial [Termitomyces sp. T112]